MTSRIGQHGESSGNHHGLFPPVRPEWIPQAMRGYLEGMYWYIFLGVAGLVLLLILFSC